MYYDPTFYNVQIGCDVVLISRYLYREIILRQTQLFVGFGLFALFVMTDFNEVAGEQLFRRMAFFNIIKCRLFFEWFPETQTVPVL